MTRALDITAEQRKTLLALLRQFIPGVLVWAYGSRAKWTARPNSDLDLVVFVTAKQREQVAKLKDALVESNFPFLVDIHIWDEVPERFHAIIRKEYIVFQDESEERLSGDPVNAGWSTRTLGDLTDNFDGQRIPVKEADRRPGVYPYYGASGIVDHVDRYIFDGEYLLIAEDGENLRTCKTPIAFLARGKFWVNNHAHIVRGNKEADTRFLMYALNNGNISGYLTGSTMPKLTQGNMNRIPIFAPPPAEQRAIADVLGTLDDKIELNRRMNETQEALARTLFHEIRNESAGTKGKLRECCERVENGGTPKRNEPRYWEPPIIPWLTSGEVRQPIVTKTENMISEEGLANSSAKLWPAATTVVALYGATAGQVCFLGDAMCANQACCGLIPKNDMRYFVYLHMSSSVAALEQQARGSAQQNLSQQIVADFPVTIPSPDTLTKFDEAVHPLFTRWIANLEESRTLAALRDALLPKLLSGAVRVKEAA